MERRNFKQINICTKIEKDPQSRKEMKKDVDNINFQTCLKR